MSPAEVSPLDQEKGSDNAGTRLEFTIEANRQHRSNT